VTAHDRTLSTLQAVSDLDLIQAARGGDRAAFDALLRLHQDRVFSICLATIRDRELALDATQETFITLFRKLDRFDGRSAFSTWLYRVTMNTCYDVLRRARRHATETFPEHLDPADPSSSDQFAAADVRPELAEALASIPEEFRVAVVLSDLEGLPLAEVADILDVPIGTVKSRVFRGRRLLADILRNQIAPNERPIST
jgi:RNA polymerase sigma-70 factor (ECF subfamily)